MPRRCTICEHRSHKAIDRALLRNESHAAIARRFHLSSDAIARHKHQHVENALHVAMEEGKRDARYGNSLLEQLTSISQDCERLIVAAEANRDIRSALMGISQRLKIWESQAKLAGASPQAPSVMINQQFNQTINLAPEDADKEIALLMQKITDNFAPEEIERYRSLANGQAQPLLMGETS